ncbi:MAG TPA: hypothetical protein VIL97_06600, partial [Thermoanaerobaculia bacterium]
EEELWFTGTAPDGELGEYPQRPVEPHAIYAIQFIHFPPEDLPITAQKLYRVLRVEPETGEPENLKEFAEGSTDRYYRFTFLADTGERFTYAFHLDDPGVNYFTHKEIMSLAMKTV